MCIWDTPSSLPIEVHVGVSVWRRDSFILELQISMKLDLAPDYFKTSP